MNMVLPVDVASPDRLSELLLELQDVLSALRDAMAQRKTARAPLDTIGLSPELDQLLEKNRIAANDTAALETLAKNLTDLLEHAPVAHLLLAAMPGRALRRQIVEWFRAEINPLALVTFTARGDIGGGLVLQTGSHVYDWSFRRAIIDNRSRLTEIAGV